MVGWKIPVKKIIAYIDPDLCELSYLQNRHKDIKASGVALKDSGLIEISTLGHSMKGSGRRGIRIHANPCGWGCY